jgi:hypothetical protein
MPKSHPSFASQRDYFYTIHILDPHGRSIGLEELPKPTTRAQAYKKLMSILNALGKTDDLVYGGYLNRDDRNPRVL